MGEREVVRVELAELAIVALVARDAGTLHRCIGRATLGQLQIQGGGQVGGYT